MSLKTILLASVATTALLAGISVQGVAYAAAIPVAESYSDLLDPVPDAQTRLMADNFRRERANGVQLAYDSPDHHHHQYHHHYRDREWYQANGYTWDGYRWVLRPRYDHHHHHYQHHHHHYN